MIYSASTIDPMKLLHESVLNLLMFSTLATPFLHRSDVPETQLEDLPTQQLPQETPQKAPVKTRFALGKSETVGDSQSWSQLGLSGADTQEADSLPTLLFWRLFSLFAAKDVMKLAHLHRM